MKNKIFQLSIFILLILSYIYHRELFITQQKLTLLLMKNITYALKNKKVIYYIFFIFLYGMLHSLAPGHGKSYILNLSLKYSLLKLLIISALIAYGQGLVSYFVATFFIKSISQLQNIDLISKNIYSITLILLASFNLINEFKNKHIENSKFIFGLFFPCSGILSVLLLGNMLNKNIPFGYLILAMSSGIFLTLSIFSFIIKNITFSFNLKKNKNYIKYSNLSLNLIILLLGMYMLLK